MIADTVWNDCKLNNLSAAMVNVVQKITLQCHKQSMLNDTVFKTDPKMIMALILTSVVSNQNTQEVKMDAI